MQSWLKIIVIWKIVGLSHAILPFQVNNVKSCQTQISIGIATLSGIERGDVNAPCTGYLSYTNAAHTRMMCLRPGEVFTHYAAQRACYTLGANTWRNERDPFGRENYMLYRCFDYASKGVINADAERSSEELFVIDEDALQQGGQGCEDNDPSSYTCYDRCYHTNDQEPLRLTQDNCADDIPLVAIACSDIDECLEGVRKNCSSPFEESCFKNEACGQNTECTNHIGSFQCTCLPGFENYFDSEFDPYEKGCKDINECLQGKCHENANCFNSAGSFTCSCKTGYVGDGFTCTDDNECLGGTNNCPADRVCENTPGSYECLPPEPIRCEPNPCINGDCFTNDENEEDCRCNRGYSGDLCERKLGPDIGLIIGIVAACWVGLLTFLCLIALRRRYMIYLMNQQLPRIPRPRINYQFPNRPFRRLWTRRTWFQ